MVGDLVPGVVGEDIELSKHTNPVGYDVGKPVFCTFKINRKYLNVKMDK